MQEKTHPFEEIGPALRLMRKRRKLVQQDVADHLGINKAAISRLEQPQSNPTTNSVGNYLLAIEATAQELFDTLAEIRGEKKPEPSAEARSEESREKEGSRREADNLLRKVRDQIRGELKLDDDSLRNTDSLLNYYRHEFVNLHERLAILETRLDEVVSAASLLYDRNKDGSS